MKQNMSSTYHIPAAPRRLLTAAGALLAAARKSKRMPQAELAARIGVSRQTIARMEKGDATVAIGLYLATAWILDVALFPGMEQGSNSNIISQLVLLLNQHLPKRIALKHEKNIPDQF